jgi:hypothetical protein
MLKAMIDRITELATPKTFEIEGRVYSSSDLYHIENMKCRPKPIEVTGLDRLCKLVRNEADHVGRKLFVQVKNFKEVAVFTTLDDEEERFRLYTCVADTPNVTTGSFMPYEKAIIELRSLYIPNEDHTYLLKLISSVSSESKVTSSDNGVTQAVEAKTGIALNSMVQVKPRVALRPFRTFIEVEQPESDFLLRISERGEIGVFPADGGVWKLEATRNIAGYFEEALKDLIESGSVVVIR